MEKYSAPKMEVVKFDEEAAISMFNPPCLGGNSGPGIQLPGHGGEGDYNASC